MYRTHISPIPHILSLLLGTYYAQSLHRQSLYPCRNAISFWSLIRNPFVIPVESHTHLDYTTHLGFPCLHNIIHYISTNHRYIHGTIRYPWVSYYANLSSFLFAPHAPIDYTIYIASYTILPRTNVISVSLHDILLLAMTQSTCHSCLNHMHILTTPHLLSTRLHRIMHNRYTNYRYIRVATRYPSDYWYAIISSIMYEQYASLDYTTRFAYHTWTASCTHVPCTITLSVSLTGVQWSGSRIIVCSPWLFAQNTSPPPSLALSTISYTHIRYNRSSLRLPSLDTLIWSFVHHVWSRTQRDTHCPIHTRYCIHRYNTLPYHYTLTPYLFPKQPPRVTNHHLPTNSPPLVFLSPFFLYTHLHHIISQTTHTRIMKISTNTPLSKPPPHPINISLYLSWKILDQKQSPNHSQSSTWKVLHFSECRPRSNTARVEKWPPPKQMPSRGLRTTTNHSISTTRRE